MTFRKALGAPVRFIGNVLIVSGLFILALASRIVGIDLVKSFYLEVADQLSQDPRVQEPFK